MLEHKRTCLMNDFRSEKILQFSSKRETDGFSNTKNFSQNVKLGAVSNSNRKLLIEEKEIDYYTRILF